MAQIPLLTRLPLAHQPWAQWSEQDQKGTPSESQGITACETLWECHTNMGLEELAARGEMGCVQMGVAEQCKCPGLSCVH